MSTLVDLKMDRVGIRLTFIFFFFRELTQSLLTLCDGIGMYLDQFATIQSGQKFDGDLKSIVHFGRTCDEKASKLLSILYQGLKLDDAARLIHGMEIFCQHRGMTLDYAEASVDDLKRSIDWFRVHYIEFHNCANGMIKLYF